MTAKSQVILNADSNRVRRNRTERLLSGEGYILHSAESKEECLALAALHRPDLVLLSWDLSGIAGAEISTLLKDSPEGRPLVILRVPGSRSMNIASHMANCSADAFLPEGAGGPLVLATVAALSRSSSARLSATQDAVRLQEDVHRFVARVSHDLVEPLRMMTTFGHMLGEDSTDRLTAGERTYLEYVLGGVERARRLLQYMLEYSHAGADPSSRGPVSLSLVVTLAINVFKKRIEETGASINLEEPLPTVWGNAQELQRVLQSLIGNALKYRQPEEPPAVTLKAVRHSPTEWLVSVADKGIGIPPRHHESIFEPFERLHGKEVPGCGMGLALARRIIEAHQGRVWVESEPDQGATFYVSLPARD